MAELIEEIRIVWMNMVLGNKLSSYIISIAAFLLFYHWSLYKLTKKKYSIIKASLIILAAFVAFKSLFFLLQYPHRDPSVRSSDLYYYVTNLIKLSAVYFAYTFLYIHLLKKQNARYNLLISLTVFICFYLYYTDFAVYFKRGLDGNFLFRSVWDFILAIIATALDAFFRYIFKLQQIKEGQAKMENLVLREQIVKSQYEVLHAKVNPHFLYNALNSIAGLALIDGEKTKKMALSLSRFFKYSINREADNTITVEKEVEMINTYLQIEKIRFEDRLKFSISAATDTLHLKIPRLLLQPLVENSVRHGQNPKDYTVDIHVDIKKIDSKLLISVQDKGQPYEEDIKPGFGLKSVHDKLDLFCPGKYEISLVNSPAKAMEITIAL